MDDEHQEVTDRAGGDPWVASGDHPERDGVGVGGDPPEETTGPEAAHEATYVQGSIRGVRRRGLYFFEKPYENQGLTFPELLNLQKLLNEMIKKETTRLMDHR